MGLIHACMKNEDPYVAGGRIHNGYTELITCNYYVTDNVYLSIQVIKMLNTGYTFSRFCKGVQVQVCTVPTNPTSEYVNTSFTSRTRQVPSHSRRHALRESI
jgi:hypothetical protein